MKRLITDTLALVLVLALVLAMPAPACAYWGIGWDESDSGPSEPVVGVGEQKEFAPQEEETTCAPETEETETTEETFLEEAGEPVEMPVQPDAEAPASGKPAEKEPWSAPTEEAPADVLPAPSEGESFVDRLFFRKVTQTEKWKLFVPAIGTAAALAALGLMRKKPKNQDAPGNTTMSDWSEFE